MAEGASQWAITEKVPLMQAPCLLILHSRGRSRTEGVTAEDVLAARNTIGIDIGEGTLTSRCLPTASSTQTPL